MLGYKFNLKAPIFNLFAYASFRCALLITGALIICSIPARAQISPGELHRSHAFLEGVGECSKCHGSDRKLVSEKCLDCHSLIKAEQQTGTGYHGLPGHDTCQKCHVEHQGRNFELIYWEKGQGNYDHNLAEFKLLGKHKNVECRSCHNPKNFKNKAGLESFKVNLERTFLGLDSACGSCHFDEHRGQLPGTCGSCHTVDSWRPAPGFDHNKTKYILTGKHQSVMCDKCHPVVKNFSLAGDSVYVKFASLPHDQCNNCHSDLHKGKFGPVCDKCHTTLAWTDRGKGKFDHGRTNYPLLGKHVGVACEKCHVGDKHWTGLKFQKCRDCHEDFHKGEFAHRQNSGACEECHTVDSFSPSIFLLAQHDRTDYPLQGAHRAVPCVSCHELKNARSDSIVCKFKFSSTRCLDCHKDYHQGQLDKYVTAKGCEYCHVVGGWGKVQFDHGSTKFKLEGRHLEIACVKCHSREKADTKAGTLVFEDKRKICSDCHKDIHRGQFASATDPADCQACHTALNWKADKFNHNVASQFALAGAHKTVPCIKCHFEKEIAAEKYIVYKPLDRSCASCHDGKNMM